MRLHFLERLLVRRVRRVAFLPPELRRAQKERVRSSQRITLHHWFNSSGRSR
jgi:hypothetical protein